MKTCRRRLGFLPLLLALASAASQPAMQAAAQQDAASAAAGDEEVATSEPEIDRAHFEELAADRTAVLAEAQALESDARSARGDDQTALRDRALELRLESVNALEEMAAVIERFAIGKHDATAELRTVAAALPEARRSRNGPLMPNLKKC